MGLIKGNDRKWIMCFVGYEVLFTKLFVQWRMHGNEIMYPMCTGWISMHHSSLYKCPHIIAFTVHTILTKAPLPIFSTFEAVLLLFLLHHSEFSANRLQAHIKKITIYLIHYNQPTESAILKIHNDIIISMDKGEVTTLTLLDLPAAFDTIDHAT